MNPGDVVAERFEVERAVSSGGFGVVYRATDRLDAQPVALKLLVPGDAGTSERFEREARALAGLRHPAIVRYVAHGATPAGELYLAMEWLEGEDLGERLNRSRMTIGECVMLATRVAEALGCAHAQGVVHRDVKPENVFLPGGDVARTKILDFGVARLGAGARGPTKTGVMVGTPGYMAPEQASGSKDIDARADVFALGCVLHECLTGTPVFQADDVLALLAKILLDEAPRVAELRPGIPAELDDLVARLLSKERTARPKDGAEVAMALAELGPIVETDAAPGPVRRVMLTTGEQRLLCVVAMGARTDVGAAPDETMRGVVQTYGGRLERLAGGAMIVTLSGARTATDQATAAARCALAMHAVMPTSQLALATGRGVLAGRSPVGEVLDRAARLLRGELPTRQERASRDTIITRPATVTGSRRAKGREARAVRIDDVTAGLLGPRFDVRGTEGMLELCAEREQVDAARLLMGKPTPCVGREPELATLEAVWDGCVAEPMARVVLVTAPAGVGKSRLRSELVRRLEDRDGPLEVWIGRGDPMRAGSPFGLIGPALRRAAGVVDGEPLELSRKNLRARVSRHLAGEDRDRVTEFLGELLGVPFPDDDSVQLRAARTDAMLMGDQIRRAFEDWLLAEVSARPVLLVLEDLQNGDLPTVKLIDAGLRHVADRPFMVLAMARADVHAQFPNLWSEREVQEIRLAPLPRRAAEKLARHVLGDGVGPEKVARLVEQAAGNAFFLEELLRAVADGRDGELPATVLAMVQARLEGIGAEPRRILRAASVFGEVFWRGAVLALLGGDERALRLDDWLAELVDRELIAKKARSKFPADEEYAFRHGLVREAAYTTLTGEDGALGHRLAGEWLERAGERDAVVLAGHYERAGEPRSAVAWYCRAAEQALEGNDLAAVLSRAERGVALGAAGDQLGRLRLLMAEAHQWRGENAEAERCGSEAMRWLPVASARWCNALREVTNACGRLGDEARLVALVDLLPGLGVEAEAVGPSIVVSASVAMNLMNLGRYELAERLLGRIEAARAAAGVWDPAVTGWIDQVHAYRADHAGDVSACRELFDSAARSLTRAGDVRNAGFALGNVGFASLCLGAYPEAKSALEEVLGVAQRMGLVALVAGVKNNLGIALARLGLLDAAERMEREAVASFEAQGDRRMEGGSRIYLASILALEGDLVGAERQAIRAAEILEVAPPLRAHALAMLAQVHLWTGDGAAALAPACEAARLLDSLGRLEEGEALVRLVHAEALFATGDVDGARTVIGVACERLLARAERMGDPTWRESFLARVPENVRTMKLAMEWG